jgi:hypothetical protein
MMDRFKVVDVHIREFFMNSRRAPTTPEVRDGSLMEFVNELLEEIYL